MRAALPTKADLDRVVRQLDDDALDDRDKASAELERFGPNAVAGVKARPSRARPWKSEAGSPGSSTGMTE